MCIRDSGTTVKIDAMSADQLADACYIEHGWEVAGQWTQMVTRRADVYKRQIQTKDLQWSSSLNASYL